MSDEELLQRAVKFDLGWMDDKNPSPKDHGYPIHFFLERRMINKDKSKWAITWAYSVLSKKHDDFIFEPTPAERDDEFLADTRFDTKEEALEYFKQWKERMKSAKQN